MKIRLPKLFIGRFEELKRPRFPVDRKLVSRQMRAAEQHPANGIKPLLIESQPETVQPFRPYDDLEYYGPIG